MGHSPDTDERDGTSVFQRHLPGLRVRAHFSQWPDWLPRGQMGAGLISWIGMLSGQYHLSIRQIQSLLLEMCRTTFSTGAISNAQGKLSEWMEALISRVGDYVRQQDVAHR
ncbi:MAG: transposase [Thiolinea sp.]